jgi:hypothetical protein
MSIKVVGLCFKNECDRLENSKFMKKLRFNVISRQIAMLAVNKNMLILGSFIQGHILFLKKKILWFKTYAKRSFQSITNTDK